MPGSRHAVRIAALLPCLFLLACATTGADEAEPEDYLRWVGYEEPLAGEFFVTRWHERQLPLRVHLPFPPEGLFPDPQAIHDSVKDGIFDWTDVAAPGVPAFVLVDDPGEADIPIVWAEEATGDWFIAYCAWAPNLRAGFRVSHVLVTARYADGRLADMHDLYITVLHEMGHALGIMGHSPAAGDVMYPSLSAQPRSGLSPRDRATLRELYRLPVGRRIVGGRRLR